MRRAEPLAVQTPDRHADGPCPSRQTVGHRPMAKGIKRLGHDALCQASQRRTHDARNRHHALRGRVSEKVRLLRLTKDATALDVRWLPQKTPGDQTGLGQRRVLAGLTRRAFPTPSAPARAEGWKGAPRV